MLTRWRTGLINGRHACCQERPGAWSWNRSGVPVIPIHLRPLGSERPPTHTKHGGEAGGGRWRRVHAGRHGGPPREPGAPVQAGRLESLRLRCSVRGIRADGILRHLVEPGAVPDDEAAPGRGAVGEQRHQLGRHHLDDARHRRLHRRRPPRPLPDLHDRLRHLPHRHDPADPGGVAAVAAAAQVRRRHSGPQVRAAGDEHAAGRLLPGAVHPGGGHWRHEAQHLHHRRGPVRRHPPAGAPPQALLLQLVDVQHLLRHAVRQHRARLHPGQRRLDHRLRAAHAGPRRLHRHLHRRHALVPPQAHLRELLRQDGQGHRRRRQEARRLRARRPARPARARRRLLRQEGRRPAPAHAQPQRPDQGGREDVDVAVAGVVAVVAQHGDAGGGDEADAEDAARAGRHVRARGDDGADQHAVRQAGDDAGPAYRPALPDPAGEPAGVRDRVHARLRRALRPRLHAAGAPDHGGPARHLAAAADGRRPRHPHRHHGHRVGDGAAPPGGGARARDPRQHGRRQHHPAHHLRAAPAVRAHGRRRRVPGGGQDRVLLRPGARGHEEPRHLVRHDQPRRRQLPQQRAALHGVARHGAPWPGRLDPQQPQRLAPGQVLRLLRTSQLRQPRRLLRRLPLLRLQQRRRIPRRRRRREQEAQAGSGDAAAGGRGRSGDHPIGVASQCSIFHYKCILVISGENGSDTNGYH